MKLNKFLVVAAAAAVLPLSVANAEGTANVPGEQPPVVEPEPFFPAGTTSSNGEGLVNYNPAKPEFKGGVNAADAPTNDVPEFKGGVNGTEAAVLDKPEYKFPKSQGTFKVEDGKTPAKAQNGQKALPKTSAVK